MADAAPPTPKRQRQFYHRHHVTRHKLQRVSTIEPAMVSGDILDKLLFDSIKKIIEEQGAKLDIYDSIVEPIAFESLRNTTEEFILGLCNAVRDSMQIGRRSVPIALDFNCVAAVLDRQVPQEQFSPQRKQEDVNSPLLPTPPPDDAFHHHTELPPEILGQELDGRAKQIQTKFIPSSLPPLPSAHTYRATEVYPVREKDPRRMRELATEEGKMGEQALRKLASASRLDNALHAEPAVSETAPVIKLPHMRRRRKPVVNEEAMFEETMRELLAAEQTQDGEVFEVGPVVSFEKKFWRPESTISKRKPPGKMLATEGSAAATSTGRQRMLDDMDTEL